MGDPSAPRRSFNPSWQTSSAVHVMVYSYQRFLFKMSLPIKGARAFGPLNKVYDLPLPLCPSAMKQTSYFPYAQQTSGVSTSPIIVLLLAMNTSSTTYNLKLVDGLPGMSATDPHTRWVSSPFSIGKKSVSGGGS